MDSDILLGLYPGYTSVLGPYLRPDGRQHVVLNNSNASKGTKGKTRTISYPKALKEIELNRRLKNHETVDHHNRNFTDDRSVNLNILPRNDHASLDAVRVAVFPVTCVECGNEFLPSATQMNIVSVNKAGPFCSKSCSGKYGARVQNGGKRILRTDIEKIYFHLAK